MSGESSAWYFAYGSNLDPGTFLGRRQMRPDAVRLGRVQGWRLVFGLPVGPGERGVANLLPDPEAEVHGVAYRLSLVEGARLDRSEGVPRAYERRPVRMLGSGEGEDLRAFTYVSRHHFPDRKPSRRYLGLILKGARHHALPGPYIDWLRGLELAVDERVPQGELFEPS